MDWPQVTITITELFFSMAALFAGVGYFRQGKAKSKLDTVTLFKEQVDALEGKVNTQTDEMAKLMKRIKMLQDAIDERDKKFAQAILAIQGRDPSMQEFMILMRSYIDTNTPLLETIKTKTIPTIERLELYLNKQTF